jgi:hypothetical protein
LRREWQEATETSAAREGWLAVRTSWWQAAGFSNEDARRRDLAVEKVSEVSVSSSGSFTGDSSSTRTGAAARMGCPVDTLSDTPTSSASSARSDREVQARVI